MKIYSLINVGNKKVPDYQVLENIDFYGLKIITQRRFVDIYGILILQAEDGVETRIDDDLVGMMHNFCLKSIPVLLEIRRCNGEIFRVHRSYLYRSG